MPVFPCPVQAPVFYRVLKAGTPTYTAPEYKVPTFWALVSEVSKPEGLTYKVLKAEGSQTQVSTSEVGTQEVFPMSSGAIYLTPAQGTGDQGTCLQGTGACLPGDRVPGLQGTVGVDLGLPDKKERTPEGAPSISETGIGISQKGI